MSRQVLNPKLLSESKTYAFDFSSLLGTGETISTASVSASVYSGTDASPGSIVSGAATIAGAIVSQLIVAGVLGVIYEVKCQITTSLSQTLNLVGFLNVLPDLV